MVNYISDQGQLLYKEVLYGDNMAVFKNKKNGYKYETKTTVHKVPSTGKYRVQGYIQVTYPNGEYETVTSMSLTFNMRKDADRVASETRKKFTTQAMMYADKTNKNYPGANARVVKGGKKKK